ncbi:MAG: hypothetical protein A2452_08695 [Candidatus Firestonebacteria bacterium RIFOXYC2_FULL_39_67]|nr:MAG: hypothetical protein A2536_09835 [Candidatus Firestonebacteria bacterium RIFOXYD2_FULL_39_29]OGF57190.1 MAG: hypothetical protein A2452_08695 [Candidatus Firestonebacteria bacterium RIFOXYC2_FULL_39_67]
MPQILIVDDEKNILEAFKLLLEDKYKVLTSDSGKEALKILDEIEVDIVLLDIMMPDMDGLEVLEKIKEKDPSIEVVMITATKTVETAVKAMKLGAYDYLVKPVDKDDILLSIRRIVNKRNLEKENLILRSEISLIYNISNMIGVSAEMQEVFKTIEKVSGSDSTVLLCGESGVGKELVARNIHSNSLRKDKSFVAVNCAAIPNELVESELFGHEKGAFTSANTANIGKFEFANEGTIFLDEASSLSMNVQAKLLRVLQEREFTRVGGNKVVKVDVRIISSTNYDLQKAVQEKTFREDLYYRLNVVPVNIPSLRERKDDIIPLAMHFLQEFNSKQHKKIKGFSDDALRLLTSYNWPGNIRELKNLVERFVVMVDSELIDVSDFPLELLTNSGSGGLMNSGKELKLLKDMVDEVEKEYIFKCLKKNNFNQTKTAKDLGIHRNTLLNKIKEKNLQ